MYLYSGASTGPQFVTLAAQACSWSAATLLRKYKAHLTILRDNKIKEPYMKIT